MLPAKAWRTDGSRVTGCDASFSFAGEKRPGMLVRPTVGCDSYFDSSSKVVWITPESSVERFVARRLSDVPLVVSVCVQVTGEDFLVWALLSHRDVDAREAVYRAEIEICDALNLFDFDFRTTTIDRVTPAELENSGFKEYFKRG